MTEAAQRQGMARDLRPDVTRRAATESPLAPGHPAASGHPTATGQRATTRNDTPATLETTNLMLADDHGLFRELLGRVLEMERDIRIVGEATNGLEAVTKARQLKPDVILMDINMPIIDGLAATRQLTEEMPTVAVIVLTMYKHNHQVLQAMRSGARGYLLKSAQASEVLSAIRTVRAGGVLIEPSLAGTVVTEYRRLSQSVEPAHGLSILTEREIEIIRYVAAGLSNREIADKLSYSEKTVKNYLSNIFSKLGIRDRTQAAIYGLRQGLIPTEEMME
ncbi:MAG TPA: response regulator transcription factor [Ktedonobacterales bacterium]|nr:response regulator transcription factor [Ktedonobacterales bacterium]